MSDCSQCGGTGFKNEIRNGYSYAIPCDHGSSTGGFERADVILSAAKDLQFNVTRLFRERPKLRDFFDPNDLMVAELILGHVGEAQAVKLDELSQTLWPEVYKQGDSARSNLARQIKAIVSKLRRPPISLRICSLRRPPYGYFMAQTPEEWIEYRNAIWHHTRAWLELLHETGDDAWLSEQLGQLQLAWTNQSADSAEHAEVKA